jgi:hypothetical protein
LFSFSHEASVMVAISATAKVLNKCFIIIIVLIISILNF